MLTLVVSQVAAVTFAGPADTAARLLPKVGAAAGLLLEADRRMKPQVLLVNVKAMPRERMLKLIADASGGKWEEITGGFRLTADNERMRDLWKETQADRTAWLGAAIKDQLKQNAAVAEMFRGVGADALAMIRPGGRIVWSDHPTRLQRPMPPSGNNASKLLMDTYRKAYERARNAGQDVEDAVAALNAGAATVLASARRGTHADSVGFGLSAYDAAGKAMMNLTGELVRPGAGALETLAKRLGERPIVFSEDVLACAGRYAGAGELNDALYARVGHPERNEPLALLAGPVVASIAKAANLDVVACLPDAAMLGAAYPVAQNIPAKQWATRLGDLSVQSALDGDVLVVRPLDRAQSIEDRFDRMAIRRRIESMEIHGQAPATFNPPTGLEKDLLSMIDRAEIEEDAGNSRLLSPVWASMTPVEKTRAVGRGQPLTPAIRNAIRHVIEAPDEPEEVGMRIWGLAMEPTVLFAPANGPEGLISAQMTRQGVALIQEPGNRFPYQASLTNVVSAFGDARSAPRMKDSRTRFWPAQETSVQFTILLASTVMPKLSLTMQMTETLRTSATATSYPRLFPELQRALSGEG